MNASLESGLTRPTDLAENIMQIPLAELVLQEWETGEMQLAPFTELAGDLNREKANSSCGWEDLCFCSTLTCRLPAHDWKPLHHWTPLHDWKPALHLGLAADVSPRRLL